MTNTTTPDIVTSAKAASLQGGIYLPITARQWKWTFDKLPNALFFAPLVKIGFETAIDSPTTTAVFSDGMATTPTVVTTTPVNPDRFYKFYGYGMRLGHFKDSHDANIAPELISYIDIVYGRSGNFDLSRASFDPTGRSTIQPYRHGIEGILKVPKTPLIIGLSANLSGPSVPLYSPRKDDLRFLTWRGGYHLMS